MARIRINDLPVLENLSEKQMKGIFGGLYTPRPNSTPQVKPWSGPLCNDDINECGYEDETAMIYEEQHQVSHCDDYQNQTPP